MGKLSPDQAKFLNNYRDQNPFASLEDQKMALDMFDYANRTKLPTLEEQIEKYLGYLNNEGNVDVIDWLEIAFNGDLVYLNNAELFTDSDRDFFKIKGLIIPEMIEQKTPLKIIMYWAKRHWYLSEPDLTYLCAVLTQSGKEDDSSETIIEADDSGSIVTTTVNTNGIVDLFHIHTMRNEDGDEPKIVFIQKDTHEAHVRNTSISYADGSKKEFRYIIVQKKI